METDRNCPDCGNTLHLKATYCGCGWGKKKKYDRGLDLPKLVCKFDTCAQTAVIFHKNARLCEQHFQEVRKKESHDYCKAIGLTTNKQCRDWLTKHSWKPKRFQDAA